MYILHSNDVDLTPKNKSPISLFIKHVFSVCFSILETNLASNLLLDDLVCNSLLVISHIM